MKMIMVSKLLRHGGWQTAGPPFLGEYREAVDRKLNRRYHLAKISCSAEGLPWAFRHAAPPRPASPGPNSTTASGTTGTRLTVYGVYQREVAGRAFEKKKGEPLTVTQSPRNLVVATLARAMQRHGARQGGVCTLQAHHIEDL